MRRALSPLFVESLSTLSALFASLREHAHTSISPRVFRPGVYIFLQTPLPYARAYTHTGAPTAGAAGQHTRARVLQDISPHQHSI